MSLGQRATTTTCLSPLNTVQGMRNILAVFLLLQLLTLATRFHRNSHAHPQGSNKQWHTTTPDKPAALGLPKHHDSAFVLRDGPAWQDVPNRCFPQMAA
eukprot:scaffold5050_cov18-Tisochrysis_lutea.AAC.3